MKKLRIAPVLVGVIYAGGNGTRLWPISTAENPKQINTVFTGKSMVVEAYRRARLFLPPERIVVVVTAALYPKVFAALDLPVRNYIIQPKNADTASAFALTALVLETLYPGAVAVTIYADHIVLNTRRYIAAVHEAARLARSKHALVTIGTKPLYPNPLFGYIKLKKERLAPNVHTAIAFVEKPTIEQARRYISSHQYVWNTGLYVWEPTAILHIFKRYATEFYQALLALRAFILTPDFDRQLARWYGYIKPVSFERQVSERMQGLYVLVADYAWKDLGNWNVIYEVAGKNAARHALLGEKPAKFVSVDSSGCLLLAPGKKVALIGVKDLVVVGDR